MALDVRGITLGRYELLERLGIGGMAEVFLAQTEGIAGFKKRVVIKRLLPEQQLDPKLIEMFFDEARLAARLSHPNICQVFDLGELDGSPYLAMEHVPGVSLSALINELVRSDTAMPLPAALRVISQLLEALYAAHTLTDEDGRPLGIIHRDVTPSNVMITPLGSVKLVDFGIARAADRRARTQTGVAMGKLGFMAPEQLRSGELDLRVDIFGAGITLYKMLTGRLPVEPNHPDVMLRRMVLADYPRPDALRRGLPPELSRITCKAMAAQRNDRYPTALDMLGEVEAFAADAGLSLGPRALIELMRSREGEPLRAAAQREGTAVTRPGPVASDTQPVQAAAFDGTQPSASVPPPLPSPVLTLDGPSSLTPTSPADAMQSQVTPVVSAVATGLTPSMAGERPLAPLVPVEPSAVSTSVTATAPAAGLPTQRRAWGIALAVLTLGAFVLAIGVSGQLAEEAAPPSAPPPVAAAPTAPPALPEPAPPEPAPLAPPEPARSDPPPDRPLAAAPRELSPPAPEPAPRPAPARRPVSAGTGELRVESERPATVRVLGRDLGVTPTTLTLPPGPHRVQLVYPDGEVHEERVTIVEDTQTVLKGPGTAR